MRGCYNKIKNKNSKITILISALNGVQENRFSSKASLNVSEKLRCFVYHLCKWLVCFYQCFLKYFSSVSSLQQKKRKAQPQDTRSGAKKYKEFKF